MLNLDILKCTYTNEQVLVILLTRLYFDTQEIEVVREFLDKGVIDWRLFYKLISHNDIRGFIYNVITVSELQIDQQIYDTLKKDAMGITLLGSYQASLAAHLAREFEKLGITVIQYKGNALATRYYKAPFFRESSDIDFLINKDELLQLKRYLNENGYEPKYNISGHQIGFILRFHREFPFKSPKDRMGITCSVELKWRLLERYFGKFHQHDFFVQHLQSYTAIEGTSYVGLTPTYDFLCVASNHLIREPLMKFKYLIDLASIVQNSRGQLDWEAISLHFKLYDFSPFLWSGMNAIAEITGLQLPVSNTPKMTYHLFTATEIRTGRSIFFNRIRIANLQRSFLGKVKFSLKARLFLLIPNLNDLSRTDAPAWTIPFIVPAKSLRFLYSYIAKKR